MMLCVYQIKLLSTFNISFLALKIQKLFYRSELSLFNRSRELVDSAPGDVPKYVSDSDSDVRESVLEKKTMKRNNFCVQIRIQILPGK